MTRALELQRYGENKFRAIILESDETGMWVADIAEAADLSDLHEWFRGQEPVTHVHCGFGQRVADWQEPDCLTVWEAALAAAGL